MNMIQVIDVTKTYKIGEVETRALSGITLEIAAGEFTALVGPSGSGKTTLLQIMGCLDRPDSGTVYVNGQDVTRLGADQRADIRRQEIGFIFQFFALVPVLTAYENVELPLLLSGLDARERRERVMAMLDAVGLADRAHHRPDQMSGGQQQRVAIARALVKRPIIVLADEPTANLDTASGEQAMAIMERLNRETGTAFVFSTHDPRVMAYARRMVRLVDGRIVEDSEVAGDGKEKSPTVLAQEGAGV
ncbi:ABC transporter ATP-binding protein [Litorilinea aerophila]|uniref:ABC transporter ATP-binding protein n=1 Tax=Litorilinea aerophila TaxID=1204385 RepID=A0A540VE89_9CHLR|nr:ABC transporter ATP-binding protein [Litorilinea aerophila]MCC9077226.1 ABC transporter ATP-binding protein [Litorilinea aerophila]